MSFAEPKAVEIAGPGLLQLLVRQALPLTKILFGELRYHYRLGAGDRLRAGETGAHDRRRRLVGTPQVARRPNGAVRQLFR